MIVKDITVEHMDIEEITINDVDHAGSLTVYNMGNFKTGKTAQTHDKMAVNSYEKAGYTLLSCIMMTVSDYLRGCKK